MFTCVGWQVHLVKELRISYLAFVIFKSVAHIINRLLQLIYLLVHLYHRRM